MRLLVVSDPELFQTYFLYQYFYCYNFHQNFVELFRMRIGGQEETRWMENVGVEQVLIAKIYI